MSIMISMCFPIFSHLNGNDMAVTKGTRLILGTNVLRRRPTDKKLSLDIWEQKKWINVWEHVDI